MKDAFRVLVGLAIYRTPLPNRVKRLLDRLDGEAPASWYDNVYQAAPRHYFDHYTKSPYYFVWSVVADRLRGARAVLEIGCGTGQLAQLLQDQGIQHYTGFDFSRKAIELARKRLPNHDLRVDDARTTQLYREIDHDVVICTEVLEHIEADLAVLAALKPGVRVIATVPNFDFTSHVRFFDNVSQVIARYGSLFEGLDVVTLWSSRTAKFFLLDGIRARA